MSFLLDTDTTVRYLRGHAVLGKRLQFHRGQLHCSVVSLTELELWLAHWRTPLAYTPYYFTFLAQVVSLSVDIGIAQEAARIGAQLRTPGTPPRSVVELLIVATALVHGLTLVTRSTGLFAGVAGLTVVDWTQP